MNTSNKCRAKDPSTCRVHGSPVAAALEAIVNHRVALSNLDRSKRSLTTVTTLEEMSEAKQLIDHDQKVYDSTFAGQSDLRRKIKPWFNDSSPTVAEKIEAQTRLKEAKAYREQVLAQSPTMVESQNNFTQITADAEQSFVGLSNNESYQPVIDSLKKLPKGTPIAIKLKNGGYIYDTAGNQTAPEYANKEKKNLLEKIAYGRNQFIDYWNKEDNERAGLSLSNSGVLIPLSSVSEIHVLPKSSFNAKLTKAVNSKAVPCKFSGFSSAEGKRWGIKGEGYYYEIEGGNNSDTHNTGLNTGVWSSSQSVFIKPWKPSEILEVKMF